MNGPQELVEPLDQKYNVGAGSLFTIGNAGMNAISVAIELKDWVFLSGAEHDLQLFKQWNCFCSPVRQHGEIIGYIDMSFSVRDDHFLMASLFTNTLQGMEAELETSDQRALVCERFQIYRLSPREKEVGYMWLNNYSALRIASELGITEGTVRNVIKKIYRKTEVCDKGQFMRKFIVNG
jgi:DNA-binding CsgD family transcriptional regulator